MSQIELNEIVDVQITRETLQLSTVGFGTLLAVHKDFQTTASGTDIVKSYANLSEVLADGFTSTTELYKVAAKYFGQDVKPAILLLGQYTEATAVASIEAIRAVNDDWYGLYVADDGSTTGPSTPTVRMMAIAEYIETTEKIFAAKSITANIIDTTDGADTTTLLAQLKAAGYDRTFFIWAGTSESQQHQAAWFGRMLPTDPGSATWAFKKLTGVNATEIAASVLSSTQRDNLFDKNGNLYSDVAGARITRPGVMVSGEFIDVMVGIDWLRQRMTERIFRLLATQPKVPYTDEGIAMIENEIRAQLRIAQNQGVIAPDTEDEPGFQIVVPRASAVDIADRAARLLQGVRFEARLAGAIHKVIIRGVVAP